MILAIGDVFARVADLDAVRELMRSMQDRVGQQPGCVRYAFAEALDDDPGHFVLVQQWSDQQALDEHYRSDAFTDYETEIGPHLARTSELRVFDAQGMFHPVTRDPIGPPQDG
jgi:quinol monooxygenase YgiN